MDKENKNKIAKKEEETLSFWKKERIFEESLSKDSPKGEYIFYDGPPFATGLPHYGHILVSTIKDAIPRYKTMRGYRVDRRWGWDCHGLPIENIVERELKISGKKEIEALGIENFNEVARSNVLSYVNEWKKTVERIARWVDFDGSYKTMDNTYIESVWWVIGEMHKKRLLYNGKKVLLYCPRCETPVSKAETQMDNSYKEIDEESVTVKFKVKGKENTYLLAWTTTPWTLPGNVALAVNSSIKYVEVVYENNKFILAKERIKEVFGDKEINLENEMEGKELIDLSYEPLFEIPKVKESNSAWRVYDADFVTTDEGTGIVHTAVVYGEDDYKLGLEKNLPIIPTLNEKGHFNEDAPKFIQGKYFKEAEDEIKKDLDKRNLLLQRKVYKHSYPHCWRCETQLFYNAIDSWFINMQGKKRKMLALNKKINWIPPHLKDGRFKNIVKDAPDWNISRNRYWAAPLPIWRCKDCNNFDVIKSISDIKEKTTSNNNYYVMRHGGSDSNVNNIVSSKKDNEHHLTEYGNSQVEKTARKLSKKKIDIIISSDFIRTKETSEIVAKKIGFSEGDIIFDERIREINTGDFNLRPVSEYRKFFSSTLEKMAKIPPNGENLHDVKKRISRFIFDLEKKYENKNILIVTHEYPVWMLYSFANGLSDKESAEIKDKKDDFIETGNFIELSLGKLPWNKDGDIDLHRPYIDEITFKCSCGGEKKRVPEVVDAWVESGAMPYASIHYPFENKRWFKRNFPAQFISEYIAQTRTWFYYTHALSTILFRKIAFENVLTTGNILAENGEKMSKSKKNFPDPNDVFDKYGVDSLRLYLLSSPVMKSEDINFSEKDLSEIYKKTISRLSNVLSFYNLFKGNKKIDYIESKNILDKWILSRLNELINDVTNGMESYLLHEATRPIEKFVDDLSTWYIRRSRDRFKGNKNSEALSTLNKVLLEFSKILAPLTPYIAEDIYLSVKGDENSKSVHLCDWPMVGAVDNSVISEMQKTRDIVTLLLEEREKEKIKVRQPLSSATIKYSVSLDIQNIIKDEINVKNIIIDENLKMKVKLDTKISDELKKEGNIREFIRNIQSLRKKEGLNTGRKVDLLVKVNKDGESLMEEFREMISKSTDTNIKFVESIQGDEITDGNLNYKIAIKK